MAVNPSCQSVKGGKVTVGLGVGELVGTGFLVGVVEGMVVAVDVCVGSGRVNVGSGEVFDITGVSGN